METYQYRAKILPEHIDSYGHMNNTKYIELYEKARWEIIAARGYTRERAKQTGQGPVLLELTCKFTKELKCGDEIIIETWCHSLTRVTQIIGQRMISLSGEVHSEATFCIGLFDIVRRRILPPTEEWLKALPHPPRNVSVS